MPKKYALDEAQEFDYRLEDEKDLPPDEQTVFVLCSLADRDRQEVWNALVKGNEVEIKVDRDGQPMGLGDGERTIRINLAENMEAQRLAVGMALRGWRNLRRKGGAEVKFPGRGVRATYVLDEDTIRDLANEVMAVSQLGARESGN